MKPNFTNNNMIYAIGFFFRINQQWQYRITCRKMKTKEVTALQCYLERSAFAEMGILPTVHTSMFADKMKSVKCRLPEQQDVI